MGYNMMNRNMNHNFQVKLSTSEIELRNKLELQEKRRKKMAKANLSETDGSKIHWDGLLFGKKKREKKSSGRPGWKQAVAKNSGSDLLDDVIKEGDGSWENMESERGRADTQDGGMQGAQETGLGYSQEKLRQAVLWAEILGEPVSKKRRKRRLSRLD